MVKSEAENLIRDVVTKLGWVTPGMLQHALVLRDPDADLPGYTSVLHLIRGLVEKGDLIMEKVAGVERKRAVSKTVREMHCAFNNDPQVKSWLTSLKHDKEALGKARKRIKQAVSAGARTLCPEISTGMKRNSNTIIRPSRELRERIFGVNAPNAASIKDRELGHRAVVNFYLILVARELGLDLVTQTISEYEIANCVAWLGDDKIMGCDFMVDQNGILKKPDGYISANGKEWCAVEVEPSYKNPVRRSKVSKLAQALAMEDDYKKVRVKGLHLDRESGMTDRVIELKVEGLILVHGRRNSLTQMLTSLSKTKHVIEYKKSPQVLVGHHFIDMDKHRLGLRSWYVDELKYCSFDAGNASLDDEVRRRLMTIENEIWPTKRSRIDQLQQMQD